MMMMMMMMMMILFERLQGDENPDLKRPQHEDRINMEKRPVSGQPHFRCWRHEDTHHNPP